MAIQFKKVDIAQGENKSRVEETGSGIQNTQYPLS